MSLRVKRKAVCALVPAGDPPSLRFGHPDVTTDDTAFLAIRRAMPFLRAYRGPALAELGHPDVTTGDTAFLRAWHTTPFLRSYRGTRPRFASDTLMSLSEGIATPAGS